MKAKITNKANAILQILLKTDAPMTASQITAADETLNINTVQNVLRNLMKGGYIEIADIVYSGTVLCRSYQVTEKSKNLTMENFANQFNSLKKSMPIPAIFAALLGNDSADADLIAELEDMIQKKKDSLPEDK